MRYSLSAVVNVYLSADTQLSKCISRSCQPHILVFLFTDVHLYEFAWLGISCFCRIWKHGIIATYPHPLAKP